MPFQRYKDVLDVFLKKRRDSELEGKNIDQAKNVGFKAYDQGIVIFEQNGCENLHAKCVCFVQQP